MLHIYHKRFARFLSDADNVAYLQLHYIGHRCRGAIEIRGQRDLRAVELFRDLLGLTRYAGIILDSRE